MIPNNDVFILTIISRHYLHGNYGRNLFLSKYFHKTCTDMHHKHISISMIFCYGDFFYLELATCKAGQPLQSMELEEKEAQKD